MALPEACQSASQPTSHLSRGLPQAFPGAYYLQHSQPSSGLPQAFPGAYSSLQHSQPSSGLPQAFPGAYSSLQHSQPTSGLPQAFPGAYSSLQHSQPSSGLPQAFPGAYSSLQHSSTPSQGVPRAQPWCTCKLTFIKYLWHSTRVTFQHLLNIYCHIYYYMDYMGLHLHGLQQ